MTVNVLDELVGMLNNAESVFQLQSRITYEDVFGDQATETSCRELGKDDRGRFRVSECLDYCPGGPQGDQ